MTENKSVGEGYTEAPIAPIVEPGINDTGFWTVSRAQL
jgi:hypothetical protein